MSMNHINHTHVSDQLMNMTEFMIQAEEHANRMFDLAKIDLERVREGSDQYDEHIQSIWYALVNEYMLTITARAMGTWNQAIKD